MYIVLTAFCLLTCIASKNSEKNMMNPLFVFCFLWGIIGLSSGLGLYNIYKASETTYLYILVCIIAFFVGYYSCTGKLSRINVRFLKKEKKEGGVSFNYSLLITVAIISVLFYLKDVYTVFTKISISSNFLRMVQNYLHNNEGFFQRSTIESLLRLLVINPMAYVLIVSTCVDFWHGKRDKKLLFLVLICSMLRVISTGGRGALIQFAGCFFISFFLTETSKVLSKKILKKYQKLFRICVILLIIIFVILTNSRAGKDALKTIYYDLSMQPYMLETWMERVNTEGIVGFGVLSFHGFFFVIDYLVRNIFSIALPNIYQLSHSIYLGIENEWIMISHNARANAYASSFLFSWGDGRWSWSIVFYFFYGFVMRKTFKDANRKNSVKSNCILCYLMLTIIYSFTRFLFSDYDFALGIVYLLFVFVKNKERATTTTSVAITN